MSGLTADGFDRKRLVDIKAEIEAALVLVFGVNIDLTPQSGFGQFIGILSEALSDQWESQENVYNSQYPSTAQGTQLSNVVMYNGILRQDATNSTVTATITGLENTVIQAGSLVSVQNTGLIFQTLVEVTIPVGLTIDVAMSSVDTGAIEAAAATLTVIETPIFGWTSVTNALDAIVGRDEETDAELRARRELSTQALGRNLVDALFGQLNNIDGVEDAVVVSNGTDSVDSNGIPAHQFESSILGGDLADIAQAIWDNTPQGILSHGDVSEIITDVQGFPQVTQFTIPSDIPIYFSLTITTNPLEFPAATGSQDIKTAIAEYGIENFKIFDNVIYSEFFCPINSIPGILSIDLSMGLAYSPTGKVNIPITLQQISRYDETQIEVLIDV